MEKIISTEPACGRGTATMQRELSNIAGALADFWLNWTARDGYSRFYFYFLPSQIKPADEENKPGALALATKQPAGFQLADPCSLGRGMTRDAVSYFLARTLSKLPIIY